MRHEICCDLLHSASCNHELLLLEKNSNMFEESDSSATKSPLHLAAYNGHHQALEVLLQSLVDLDIKDEKGRTALDLAAFKGHAECVEALISQGASVTVKDNVTKRTPLHASVINGHTPCLRLLLEVADNPDVTDAKGQTPLMLAVAYGHIDAVSLLLEKEASVDAADLLGCTALHRGIMTGHEECVQMLLEKEVSILCKDARGRTPLHFAAARGHATWLSELLQIALSEEDCSLKDNQGYTPLHWACYNGHENCIEVLLEQKFFRKFYGNSFSPLHCAVINDHENCASMLIGAIDASIVNCKDDKGRTPFHAAAFADHVECLQLLLSHSAQVNAVDHAGKTALMMAAQNGHVGAVDFLVNIAKADLTLRDKDLNTSLHLASSKGHEKCALLILDKIQEQSLINAKNNSLQTPLHIAARNGLKMVVEELLAKGACVLAVDENGHTPALACAPNKDVADCLALILATMMPFSPSSSMTAFNFACYKKDNLGRTHLCDGSAMGSINAYNKPLSNNIGTEDGYNENDSDSETF
ncbi:hypothetical protein CIB84_004749 [Bambusicola thoracicus]|uniref:Uncharacterized protein n=1 Tax=Bambusicola thoracicus TaxID=9083 RepID=A0A2P4T546_BAMTH|nr:hypothetical protein CIB84_004749 [Bambusicola thoracicus]